MQLQPVLMEKDGLNVYRKKRVLITGHTGFKGSWLSLWLTYLGAEVYGYALEPPTSPALFDLLDLKNLIHQHEIADIRDFDSIYKYINSVKPDIIFHLAAQSAVKESYNTPRETTEVNTMGTVNVMEAVRLIGLPAALVMITSDKCYENKEWMYGYRENDRLGGYDPYSATKGAAEIMIASWRNSFFNPALIRKHGVRIASARAGNVIGGGDWTKDAIVPDCIRHLQNQKPIVVRNPNATRPWQHVLEPLSGYLVLGAKLLDFNLEKAVMFGEAFNFGPHANSNRTVRELVEKIILKWGTGSWGVSSTQQQEHEATLLHLCTDKAHQTLQWQSKWNFEETIAKTIDWYKTAWRDSSRVQKLTLDQIIEYHTNYQSLPIVESPKVELRVKSKM